MEDSNMAQEKTNTEIRNDNLYNEKQIESQDLVKQKNKIKSWMIVGGIMLGIVVIVLIFLLGTHRDSREDKLKIIDTLKNEKIISENMEQIDVMSYYHWPLERCITDNYYIYKDSGSRMVAIKYEDKRYSFSDYDYLVTIYFNVNANDDINYTNSESAICDSDHSYYKYQDGSYTNNEKYELGVRKEYYVTKKSSLFNGEYYILDLAN